MPTIRENVAVLQSKHIETVTVDQNSLLATKGQPTDGIEVDHTSDVVSILVHSGRKKSAEMAKQFISWSGNKGHMYAAKGGASGKPKELNFVFKLEIMWKDGHKSQITLGQGSYFVRNNWWMGSPELNGQSIHDLKVSGISIKEDLNKTADQFISRVPKQFQGLVGLVGKPLLAELFDNVNMFKFTR